MLEGVKIDLQRKSLSEQVFQHIRRMILSEELHGGQRIPEERIAQAFGVSRTPIREAMRKLEKSGLVKIVPRSHAEVIKLDPEDSQHIGEIRIELERLAVRLLAERATHEDYEVLSEIAAACQRCADKGDIGGAFEGDSELHLEIARRSGNPYVVDILEDLGVKIQLLRTTTCVSIDSIRQDIGWHDELLVAVRDHEVERAGKLMEEHISRALSHLAAESGSGSPVQPA